MPTTSPVRVSGSWLTTWATPKSASFAKPAPAAGSASTITLLGFTSRWITPRSWAWSSASHSAIPMRRHVAVGKGARAQQLGERSAPNQLGDEVDVVLVGGELVDADYAGVVEPRGGPRLALNSLAAGVLEGDHLHRHLALELLVPGQPDDPEAARAEPPAEPVPAQHHARTGEIRAALR